MPIAPVYAASRFDRWSAYRHTKQQPAAKHSDGVDAAPTAHRSSHLIDILC